jgi:hypothetical protein
VASLSDERRGELEARLRARLENSLLLKARAWCVKGTVR